MSSISAYYNEINKYNALKSKLYAISNSLNSSASKISDLPQTITSVFSLEDTNACISNKCKKLNTDIVATSNYIKNVVIPGIDNAISRCRYMIAKLEAEQQKVVQ